MFLYHIGAAKVNPRFAGSCLKCFNETFPKIAKEKRGTNFRRKNSSWKCENLGYWNLLNLTKDDKVLSTMPELEGPSQEQLQNVQGQTKWLTKVLKVIGILFLFGFSFYGAYSYGKHSYHVVCSTGYCIMV